MHIRGREEGTPLACFIFTNNIRRSKYLPAACGLIPGGCVDSTRVCQVSTSCWMLDNLSSLWRPKKRTMVTKLWKAKSAYSWEVLGLEDLTRSERFWDQKFPKVCAIANTVLTIRSTLVLTFQSTVVLTFHSTLVLTFRCTLIHVRPQGADDNTWTTALSGLHLATSLLEYTSTD